MQSLRFSALAGKRGGDRIQLVAGLAEAKEEVADGVAAWNTLDAQQGAKGFACPKPVSMDQAAVSGYH
jgi:hypothetical protein